MALTVVKSMDVSDFWECWQHIKALVELEYEAVRTMLDGTYDLELRLIWDCEGAEDAEDGSINTSAACPPANTACLLSYNGAGATTVSSYPYTQTDVIPGYCFGCDEVVDIESSQFWLGTRYKELLLQTCLTCGGHDVGFLDRVSLRLLERIKGGVDE